MKGWNAAGTCFVSCDSVFASDVTLTLFWTSTLKRSVGAMGYLVSILSCTAIHVYGTACGRQANPKLLC